MSQLHILFRLAEAEYAVPAERVLHMESFNGATPVPGTPAYVTGLIQTRRQVVPVIDLRARFGLPASEPSLSSRVVVLNEGQRTVGLLVDSAREVQNIPPEAFKAPPEVVARQSAGFVRSVAQVKDRLVMLIDTEKVIGEETLHGDA
jgi:purine-binding chemotaxis protein CheW